MNASAKNLRFLSHGPKPAELTLRCLRSLAGRLIHEKDKKQLAVWAERRRRF